MAGKISKEANLDRSSTYAALKLLVKRGLISTYFENKRTTFVPEDPKKILDYFAEKQEEAPKPTQRKPKNEEKDLEVREEEIKIDEKGYRKKKQHEEDFGWNGPVEKF